MAQKLRDDKIGQLTHSAGNITMAASMANPAYLTIGGQQYKVTSNLVVALPAMSANTRYQVFAVLNAGVVELRISQNENSVGPAGFSRWKLVGSLIANGMSPVTFGSFVNIKGSPSTNAVDWLPTGTWVTNTQYIGKYEIDKGFADIMIKVVLSGAPSPTGVLTINLPLSIEPNDLPSAIANESELQGSGFAIDQGASYYPVIKPRYASNTSFDMVYLINGVNTAGQLSHAAPIAFNNQDRLEIKFRIPIQGWSNTAIEDL